jgi:hypothetical protein
MGHQAPSVSCRLVGTEVSPNITQYDIDLDPYPGFTWLNPSMIVDNSTPDIGDPDWSPESSIAEPYTPLQIDSNAPAIEQSPACGSFHFLNSFSLSHLYCHSTFHFDLEDHADQVLQDAVRPLDVEGPVSTSPASCTAPFEDSDIRKDSDICLGQGMAAIPTCKDDETLVRMSIKSLDAGEEPVFDLPTGWTEAFVSPSDIAAPPSPQAESMKKISVLPRIRSLLKRAASKFASRRV